MSWTDDSTTPSYAARPALSLRAFRTRSSSEPPAAESGSYTPLPRASGFAPRGTYANLPPSAAGHSLAQPLAAEHRPGAVSRLRPVAAHAHGSTPPPIPAAVRSASTRVPTRGPRPLPSFAFRLLFSEPRVWLGNPQRALLLLVLIGSSAVVTLLCLGGFLG